MIALLDVPRQLLAEVLQFGIVALRPTWIVAAENLFLRRQLALYVERRAQSRPAAGRAQETGDQSEQCVPEAGRRRA